VGKATSWVASLFAVALVTIANGADNIAVYLPMFAVSDRFALWMTTVIFATLVAVWCGMAFWLGTRPEIAWTLRRRGGRWVPWAFIALGGYVLWHHRGWEVLF
jgi:cadmium resistance protein CadD (predicted permease)